jgi:hypothetical protein
MCSSETYSKVCIDKNLSDAFIIQNGLQQGDALSPLLFISALEFAIRKVQEVRKDSNGMEHLSSWSMMMLMSGSNISTIKKNTETLLYRGHEGGWS